MTSSLTNQNMYKIEISRELSSINKNFTYKLVDDQSNFIGELKPGETKTFQLTDGTKYIKAKLMWCSSNRVYVGTLNENSKLKLTQNNFLNSRLPLLGGCFPLTFAISRYSETLKIISTSFMILFLLFLIGTLTIWRDKWLILK